MLNSIITSNESNLKYVRITDLNVSGNGQDLLLYKQKGLLGLDSYGNPVLDRCKLTGTYKLTTLLSNDIYKELCEYFDELSIIQPEYTAIVFDLKNAENSANITNLDNGSYHSSNTVYIPSGHITEILNKRHGYLVKNYENGEFNVCQLSDSNHTLYSDNNPASLDGSQGDYCIYEPTYWYKGINDHINQKMYLLFASKEPKKVEGIKIKKDECIKWNN